MNTKGCSCRSIKKQRKLNGYHNYQKHKRLKTLICQNCHQTFKTNNTKRKFCSSNCYHDKRRSKKFKKILHKACKLAFPNWKCPFCNWSQTFTIHHITKKSNGGSEDLMNLTMLCPNHHDLADNEHFDPRKLKRYAIGNFFSHKELLEIFNKRK